MRRATDGSGVHRALARTGIRSATVRGLTIRGRAGCLCPCTPGVGRHIDMGNGRTFRRTAGAGVPGTTTTITGIRFQSFVTHLRARGADLCRRRRISIRRSSSTRGHLCPTVPCTPGADPTQRLQPRRRASGGVAIPESPRLARSTIPDAVVVEPGVAFTRTTRKSRQHRTRRRL